MLFEIEPRTAPAKQAIAYWEDFLTQDELNYILARPEWADVHTAKIGVRDGTADLDIRRTQVSWMRPDQGNLHIWQKLADIFARVNSEYFGFDVRGFYEPMQLGLYTATENSHYTWHVDGGMHANSPPRKLSMALLLDDPNSFEGGNLCVKIDSDEVNTLEQKQGRAWFFPSYVLHTVTPVTKGIRRSLVLWAGGPDFR